jgi:hypothetical protein
MKQLVDLAIGMAIDDPGEDVGQLGERIDIVQLTVSIIALRTFQRPDAYPFVGIVM